MPEILMPRLSDSMEEGTIIRWLKAPGDVIRRGEELVEVETDKANITHEADADGKLEILADAGTTVPIGAPIAFIGDRASSAGQASRPKASPVARRVAAELGVDLEGVTGSGPGGRIVKADVEALAETPPPAPEPERAPAPAASAKGATDLQPLSRLQQTVARRMAETKATVPDFAVSTEVAVDAAVAFRLRLKQELSDADGPVPSLNDMVVRACARALREHARVNAAFRDGHFELYERVNVGVAVAADDALIVPVIRDADQRSLGSIARETRALAERVRNGTIEPPALAGGTFTVSNLGMLGITEFTAIVNGGQAAILAVGAVRDVPVVRDGALEPGKRMTLTLSCDHRILYGADAAAFLARVRALLETPLALII